MPAKPKKTRRRPVKRARLGGVTITVQRLSGGERFAVLVHKPDGSRQKREYKSQAEAITAYEKRCAEASRLGVVAAVSVDDDEIRAISDFKAKTADWHPRPSVSAVLAEYMERHGKNRQAFTVADAIEARLEEARKRGLSTRHVNNTESRLKPFKNQFGDSHVADITSSDVQRFIDGLSFSATSKGDALRAVHSIFSTAIRLGHVTKNPAATVRSPKTVSEEVGTISAEELARLLAAMPPRSIPAAAIMALSGLRRAEAERLAWENVKLAERIITVSAGTAKTASRRHTPITPSLAAWLELYQKAAGPVAPPAMTFRRDLETARRAAKIESWPRNCLRHGCASAWTALEPNVALVASWLGNTPDVVHAHYRALWTADEARAWQNTFPPPSAAGKVVAFPRAAG